MPLLFTRRFAPLFVTQLLGAFNDNLFKTALIFMVAYGVGDVDAGAAARLATLAAGLFTLPFLLLSGVAGSIADARDKGDVARWVKLAELGFMALGAVALLAGSVPLGLVVVVLMGAHSTIFGPIKYAILPQHLAPGELLGGTGLVEGATFVAILIGQIGAGLMAPGWTAVVAVSAAVIGIAASRFIPPAPPETSHAVDWNPVAASRTALRGAFANRSIAIATICISWFWALGAVYTAQFPPLAHFVLGAGRDVATLFLAAFSVGIAVGSVAAGRLLRGRVSARLAPWAALAMAAAGFDLWRSQVAFIGEPAGDLAAFLARPAGWRVLADLFLLATAGGVFSVPLYGILQTAGEAGGRSRAIAANNIVNAVFQIMGVLLIGAAVSAGAGVGVALMAAAATALLLVPLLRRLV